MQGNAGPLVMKLEEADAGELLSTVLLDGLHALVGLSGGVVAVAG